MELVVRHSSVRPDGRKSQEDEIRKILQEHFPESEIMRGKVRGHWALETRKNYENIYPPEYAFMFQKIVYRLFIEVHLIM